MDKLKKEIVEMRQSLQFLSSLYLTFYVEFSRDMKKQQCNLEKLARLFKERKMNQKQ